MEYLPGLTLEQLVRRYGALPAGRAVHLLRQVCLALREAHALESPSWAARPLRVRARQCC